MSEPTAEQRAQSVLDRIEGDIQGLITPDESKHILSLLIEFERETRLEDALAAHEEGMRMNSAAGEARRNGRVGVAYYRESDAETAGRIADLILAKVPR